MSDNALVERGPVVRCGNCGLALDELTNVPPDERQPCPTCGSLVRDIELHLSGEVHVTGSLSWTKIHEEVERSWPWLIGSVVLTVAGSLIGLFLGDVLGLVVGLVIGLLSFPVGLRAATRIREIEHGGER